MANTKRTPQSTIPSVPLPVQPKPDKGSIQDQPVSGPLVLARVGDSIEWVEYDPTRDPVTDAMAWVDGYEHRLSVADRVRGNPNSTEAEYLRVLNWADDDRHDRQHEAFEVLLDRIRKHPSPPYSPEVLLAEYRGLLNIPLRDRMWDRFCERMRGWLDRVNTYLSIGEMDANIIGNVVAFRSAAWFSNVTNGGLHSDHLRKASKDGRLKQSKKPGTRWFHQVYEVCSVWPEYAAVIRKAFDAETGNNPAQTGRTR